jgi:hypothetical protein
MRNIDDEHGGEIVIRADCPMSEAAFNARDCRTCSSSRSNIGWRNSGNVMFQGYSGRLAYALLMTQPPSSSSAIVVRVLR